MYSLVEYPNEDFICPFIFHNYFSHPLTHNSNSLDNETIKTALNIDNQINVVMSMMTLQ